MNKLPDCDDLFIKFFARWYTDDWRKWKRYKATRPDLEKVDSVIGCVASDLSPLSENGQKQAAGMVKTTFEAARCDWPEYLAVQPPISLAWIDSFDTHYDRSRIAEIISRSDPKDFSNEYLVLCCGFGSVLGNILVDELASLDWVYAWPYWESMLFHSLSGSLIPPFHWAIKKMSEYGVDDGFSAKIIKCIEILREKESLV
jgi:hypothetical protein